MSSRIPRNSIFGVVNEDNYNDSSSRDIPSLRNTSIDSGIWPSNKDNNELGQEFIETSSSVRSKSLYLSNLDFRSKNGSDKINNFLLSNRKKSFPPSSENPIALPPSNLSQTNEGFLSMMLTQQSSFIPQNSSSEDPFFKSKGLNETAKLLDNYISDDNASTIPNNIAPDSDSLPSCSLSLSNNHYDSISNSKNIQNLPTSNLPDNQTSFNHDNIHKLKRKSQVLIDMACWPLQYLPAVFLGLIFNLLDGISYGLITFPLSIPVYEHMGPIGLSMFFVSTIVCQVVITGGFSAFRGGNGLMMIEVIPFLYQMCNIILENVGANNKDRVIATTLMSYALSSIMTGLFFLSLGALKIGKLVDFFPRHILVGCIGGVGYFLVQTGLEVMSSVPFSFSIPTLIKYLEFDKFKLWGSALALSLLLRGLTYRFRGPMLVPLFCVMIPVVFYFIVFAAGIPMDKLRNDGWVFPLAASDTPFYQYITLFDFGNTDWKAVWLTVPTMLGLSFFGILHVPINAPALAVSINMNKLDTDRELVAHGVSNMVSGLFGSFQNYLCYSNSVLFYRSGGDSRLAGLMLALATLSLLIGGPSIIGFIPTLVVGTLIFHLGFELMKEALVDTWGVVNNIEYFTISLIVITMALVGFNEGILLGVVLACVFFILLYSNRTVIWKSCNGLSARSTVRRLYKQKLFLDQVVQQIHVLRLQGFMFFGTINYVEDTIMLLLKQRQWEHNPIRFLIIDFAFVTGMDFSAAEVFIRLRRILSSKQIHLVISGVSPNSEVAIALIASGVWNTSRKPVSDLIAEINMGSLDTTYVHTFSGLNASLEWCENYLLEYYIAYSNSLENDENQDETTSDAIKTNIEMASPLKLSDDNLYSSSPRLNMLSKASQSVMNPYSKKKLGNEKGTSTGLSPRSGSKTLPQNVHPAIKLLARALQQDHAAPPVDKFMFLAPYFKEISVKPGEYLWQKDTVPKGLYLVKSGVLSASIASYSARSAHNGLDANVNIEGETIFNENAFESIISGTLFGEISLFTGRNYNNNVSSEEGAELYLLSKEDFDALSKTEPEKMLEFVKLVLVYTDQYISSVSSFCY
ncbi:hypothetical protein BB559_002368 [Furculomyces boomerangus]|uniref:STAS domain-containing protein n=1 Tax=Furculomyces boomerangus TaxID=61424 RepID=A0A2T9YVZ9_9FUNG|nr:hypothetical protein BB559_002368 [Furculomyces boomerangus]